MKRRPASRPPASPAPKKRRAVSAPAAPDDRKSASIVGLGASAGGLEALEAFLSGVPAASGLAFVVVQHLDPTHQAMLSELLQRRTAMRVVEVEDGARIESDHVHVIPPNREMTVLHGTLRLFDPAEPRGKRLPIDHFLRSLADDQRERAIAVILSGMGTDGTLGVKAIKEAGGLVLVQDPTEAKFDSMPRSALDTGLYDVVASAAELCPRLVQLLAQPSLARTADAEIPESATEWLEKVLLLLRGRTGHDFSEYKPSTILRRVERRMAVHQNPKIALFLRFLQENPQELDLLFKELLIGVTSFFRDPAAWDFLAREALPTLIDDSADGTTLRAWTPGCSTGEEAYSLSIVFRETLERSRPGRRLGLQIFATDLDPGAIQQARRGVYPANIAADVSPERLARFFVEEESPAGGLRSGRFRIAKEIRERVTLATQNVLSDPPFTKLHMIVCRNLLIYLRPEAQKKLLAKFAYSLRPGGVLFLGNAESFGDSGDLFAPLDAKARIFRREGSTRALKPTSVATPPVSPAAPRAAAVDTERAAGTLQSLADQVMLQRFAPAAVLVNAAGDILYVSGRTGRFLEPATGKANFNLLAMARDGLRHELPRLLHLATKSREPATLRGLRVKTDGDFQNVDVTAQAMGTEEGLQGSFMVVFAARPGETETKSAGRKRASASHGVAAKGADDETTRLRDELRTLHHAMQASQEELTSANEELQSTNEELQSTNEELTTSQEELQSLNEELQTVNAELQSKLDELLQTNNDMKNLLNSTEIATLFLDSALNVRRFTTQATRIFKLIAGDIGRPITDIVTDLEYPVLRTDVEEVLRTLLSIEKEVTTTDGRWFSARVLPYRTADNFIDGVVLTFSEITAAKRLESELRRLGGER